MKWEKQEQLVESGQGYIDLVTTPSMPGTYACKTLKNPKRCNRFKSEISLLNRLHERGCRVVRIVDSGSGPDGPRRKPNCPYFVMPYYSCGSLGSHRIGNGTYPFGGSIEAAIKAFFELALELRRIHEQAIYHRDLKPQNILVRDDGQLDIADFGIGIDLEGAIQDRLTGTDEQIGSRFYMAPECLDGRQFVPSPAPDVYAMGKILAFMLWGKDLQELKPDNSNLNLIDHMFGAGINKCILAMTQEDPELRKRGWDLSLNAIRDMLHPPAKAADGDSSLPKVNPQRLLTLQAAASEKKSLQIKEETFRSRGESLVQMLRQCIETSERTKEVERIANDIGWEVYWDSSWPFRGGLDIKGREAIHDFGAWVSVRLARPDGSVAVLAGTYTDGISKEARRDISLVIVTAVVNRVEDFSAPSFENDDVRVCTLELVDPNDEKVLRNLCDQMIARWEVHVADLINEIDRTDS
jgi:serine/threonine protein kinase